MYQFFVEDSQISASGAVIEGSDVNHIKNVLRMKPGEKVRISAHSGKSYICRMAEITETFARADILEECEEDTELKAKLYLFQGLPKSDKMELIIQKAVELGAYEIVPVAMKNCVVKLDSRKAENKTGRWQEIARSAAKQAKRSRIPAVHTPLSYQQALEFAGNLDAVFLLYENEHGMAMTKEAVESLRPGQKVGIFIGPEGGFAPEEIAEAKDRQIRTLSLGKRILRTETAGLAVLSILMYHLELLETETELRLPGHGAQE